MKYTCINIQGNLISEEILQKIEQAEAQGQLATDFGLEPGSNIRSEIEYAWSRIKLDWKHFNDKSQNLPTSDPYGTTLSRKWMEQFLSSLGFDLSRPKSGLLGDNNHSYTISHTAENLDHLPIHIVGFSEPSHPDKNTLDIKTSGGTSKFSPHGTMQEYLNVTENIYGIATNGLFLRLIRDSGRLIKLTYVEFDIKRMMDEDKYSEFTLLYRLLHASRFPRNKEEAEQCFLETYYKESIETGNRIRDGLSLAVKESLVALGKGFLQNENNTTLREKIQAGTLSSKDYYRQLLRIIYRFLFLMVTEERDLVYDPEDKSEITQRLKKIYLQFYSIARLRKLSESHYVYEAQFNDLWQGLVNTFLLFEGGSNGKKLGIQPLNGDLFSSQAITDLQGSLINNRLLLECVKNLNEFRDENKNLVAINYRSLDVEELGSVYEGLLELHPVIENIEASNPAHINFTFHEGTDRKTTGSYYTRPELVNELIKSALIPVIEERVKAHIGNTAAQAKALLKLKVCDAAAGSGHMLLAAARTIAWYLARVQSGEENPAPSVYRKCLREVIQHCIYAVDFNPDAVELCKLALWLEGHNSGKPLSFLDHKIRNGNSLVGVTDLSVLQKGIPDDAFNPVTGDDKKICQELKKDNAKYNKTKQTTLDFDQTGKIDTTAFTGDYEELENIQQDDVEGVQQVKTKFEKFRNNHTWFKDWRACNLWTAAFFWNYTEENKQASPNSERLATFLSNPAAAYGSMIGKADALSMEHKFFHWPLEFPDVFEQGGFDVMLGNPPWETLQIEDKQYFKGKREYIVYLKGDERKKEITKLLKDDSDFKIAYEKFKHADESVKKSIRGGVTFALTANGKINTYAIFTELAYRITNQKGKIGLIIPTGIATDEGTTPFFNKIIDEGVFEKIIGFENEEFIFPDVANVVKLGIFVINKLKSVNSQYAFYLRRIEQLTEKERFFNLTKEELELFSPNTKNAPLFRSIIDVKINTGVYNRHKVFISAINNQWDIEYRKGLFNMSSDSKLFLKAPTQNSFPLYEAKLIWHYNHRFGSYHLKGVLKGKGGRGLPELDTTYFCDPLFKPVPQYWIEEEILEDFIPEFWVRKWFFIFRDVSSAKLERTGVFTIIPKAAIGDTCLLILPKKDEVFTSLLLLANFNTHIFDYLLRQKVSGTHLSFFVFNQIPVISKEAYSAEVLLLLFCYSLELTYSSWDIKAFADDVWKEADADLKAAITKQWEENKAVTGGHEWTPPEWCEIDEAGCPLPPFKWDESRRAVLKAELDAIYAKLYGLTTEELRYILDPQDVYGEDFPGETFRVLKEKETRLYGEYRTKRLVSEAWEKMNKNENN